MFNCVGCGGGSLEPGAEVDIPAVSCCDGEMEEKPVVGPTRRGDLSSSCLKLRGEDMVFDCLSRYVGRKESRRDRFVVGFDPPPYTP